MGAMGLAARILEQAPTEDFRDMIHDEVDKWVDQILKITKFQTVMQIHSPEITDYEFEKAIFPRRSA